MTTPTTPSSAKENVNALALFSVFILCLTVYVFSFILTQNNTLCAQNSVLITKGTELIISEIKQSRDLRKEYWDGYSEGLSACYHQQK